MPFIQMPTTTPSNPQVGDMYLSLTDGMIRIWVNNNWQVFDNKPVEGWKPGLIPQKHYDRWDIED